MSAQPRKSVSAAEMFDRLASQCRHDTSLWGRCICCGKTWAEQVAERQIRGSAWYGRPTASERGRRSVSPLAEELADRAVCERTDGGGIKALLFTSQGERFEGYGPDQPSAIGDLARNLDRWAAELMPE